MYLASTGNGYSLAMLFEDQAKRTPDNVAVVFEDLQFTYAQIQLLSNRVANWAHNQGLKKGDVVALMMENRPEFIITWLGLAKIGVITAFINYRLHGPSLAHVLNISEASVYVVGVELLETFKRVRSNEPNLFVYVGESFRNHNFPVILILKC